jgi:hypothetical protein
LERRGRGVRLVFVSDGPRVGAPEVCLWRAAARRPRPSLPSRLIRLRPDVTIGACWGGAHLRCVEGLGLRRGVRLTPTPV